MLGKKKDRIFGHIIEEHVNNAAFLWMLRDVAVNQAHHTPVSLAKLETRINKHLKGSLASIPDVAWEYAMEAAEIAGGGESFVLTTLAFHHDDKRKIETALERGAADQNTLRGLVSALAWLPDSLIFPRLKPWMYSEDALRRYLSVAVCSLRRLNPKNHLHILFKNSVDEDARLLSRSLRLTGELKRQDLLSLINPYLTHDDSDVKFWASWSALMLGDNRALPVIHGYITATNPHQLRAITSALRRMDSDEAWSCINALIQAPNHIQEASVALATLGDPHGISWLLSRMEEKAHAQVAGEAFTLITGLDIAEGLQQEPLSAASDAHGDDPEEIPCLDDYSNLPFPDVAKVMEQWQNVRRQFKAGSRYFLGQPVASQSLEHTLNSGRQSQRQWAAQELAMQQRSLPFPNIKALQEQKP